MENNKPTENIIGTLKNLETSFLDRDPLNVTKVGEYGLKLDLKFSFPASVALYRTKETHLKAIESYILAAIEKGQTYCEITTNQQFISKENIQILKDAGYTVTEKESMAGKEIKISWE